MADLKELGEFEGRAVLSAGVSIRRAGDGLSKSLEVDPVVLHTGETVHVVVECTVDQIQFDPIDDTDGYKRVHILRAGTATLVDRSVVGKYLDAQLKRIEAAQEIEGQERIEVDDEDGGDEEA